MHIADLFFEFITAQGSEEAAEAVDELLSALRLNGQVLGREHPIIHEAAGYRVVAMIPHEEALAEAHASRWVINRLSRLEAVGLRTPAVRLLGVDPLGADPCACPARSGFILYTTYVCLESPLRCADCFQPVPLYSVPPTADEEFHDVTSWQSDYQACDHLQMNCRTGERFGLREMGQPESSLSRQGRAVCRKIEAATGLPVYYYLHRYRMRRRAADATQPCPACGGAWRLAEREHDRFDFRCDPCRLLSNLSGS
ncbi:MAG: Zn-ribbon-containing protein [Armatimonadetes bacterium]|jgi:predicted  nucleic acid-binding Zn ribbon protein|nr:Zn-ribbon-containing protein [Armatimonadota bacterium]